MDYSSNAGVSCAEKELSLSVEPLLLEHGPPQPMDWQHLMDRLPVNGNSKDGTKSVSKHAGAAYLFLRILVVLLLLAVGWQLFVAICRLSFGKGAQQNNNNAHYNGPLFADEEPEIVNEFAAFEQNFSRIWANERERKERFNVFKRNVREIERLNSLVKMERRNVSYGVNGMADKDEQQFRKMLLPLGYYKNLRKNAQFIRTMNPILRRAFTAAGSEEKEQQQADDYPTHFDWREKGVVTPVKAQGHCGSCWAFASVATVESAYAVAHGDLRSLSEQELLDCNLDNNACDGGNVDRAFKFIHERGLVSEGEYPYLAERQNKCLLNDKSKNLTKIDVAVFINPDEGSMLDWLVNFGPVNVGINVPPDMKPYKSGIYHPSDYDCKFRVVGEHALLVVGYGLTEDGVKYWIVKNSWGNTWGQEHGYVNFIRGINACGIEDEPIGLLA